MATPTVSYDPYRLPTDAAPSRYDVRLRPDLESATFAGEVTIQIDVGGTLDRLVLNAAELDITACQVDGHDATWELDEGTERMIVTPASTLSGPDTTLTIRFDGVLNDLLRGFYRSTYVDENGVEQVIATTQMESTDCRRAFPCWDEPEFKAVFGITLDVADGLTAISNGPETERTSADGRTVIRFADTMVMSTYLVAFVVGRLESTDPVEVNGVPLRVVHVPGKGHLTPFGLEVGAFCVDWFERYYGIAYPGGKIDLVALPDFAAGAMENLGCITFRENLVLVDLETSTQNEQQAVVDVVAHEIAHMWFGDLVTMRWWNGIWLNEAFATFMEVAACDAFRPEWERWTSFGVERSAAFDTDSLDSTRPVEYEVRSPADCEGMFDVLTYQKGGALLRMLEQYLGEVQFREGVGHYLRTHSYANTETNDLWDAIEATSGEPVRRIMDSWIWQEGYPVVSAALRTSDGGSAEVELRQQRFRFGAEQAGDPTWVIPVHVRNGDSTTTVLVDAADAAITVPLDHPDEAVIVNAGGHGFFRVSYDEALRSRITGDALASLNTLERYNLVADAWAAAVAGRLAADELLAFLAGFDGEREHTVWQAIVTALRGLSRLVEERAEESFRLTVQRLVRPALTDLGEPQPGERDLTGKLRGLLITTLGVLGADPDTRDRCRALFDIAATDGAGVHPELIAAATNVVAASGDAATYERMMAGFRDGATPQDQLRHLYALADFDDPDLVRRTCELAMSDEVKTQNAPFLIGAAIANRRHGPVAWEFVHRNWIAANDRFPSNTIVRMISSVRVRTEPEVVADVQAFFAEHPIEQALKTMEQILERQRVNASMREAQAEPFSDALLQHHG
ncbi:MAG: M1 family metallopeptidase [Ilumatobacteraceae bacterium]